MIMGNDLANAMTKVIRSDSRSTAAMADSRVSRKLEEQLLSVIATQARRVPYPVALISLIIVGLVAQYVPPIAWGPWLAMVGIVLVARWFVLPWLANNKDIPLKRRLRIAQLLSGINGVVHGSSLAFFLYLTDFERALQTMFLVGLCTGAIATTIGYRPIFLAFFLPILPPLFLLWAWSPGSEADYWVNGSVAVLVATFGLILVKLADDSFKLFRDAFAAGRAKTRFLAAASHDLRQPLATMTVYGAALALRPLDEKSREITKQMNAALQVLSTQFDALLDLSRLDAGDIKVNIEPVDLTELIEQLRVEFEPIAVDKGLSLNIHCPDNVIAMTDKAWIVSPVVNVLSNAVKYTDSGHIDIAVNRVKNGYDLTISDTGPGIPAEEMDSIFEPFHQVSNPHRDRKEGYGLGLAIVERTLNLLGHQWQMESEEGHGTLFLVSLPGGPGEIRQTEPEDDNVSLAGLKVLAVDDDPDVALGTKTLLEEMGCDVSIAAGTSQAAAAVKDSKPDILLVDFRLRDGDTGLETVRAAREIHPGLPAIMISGDTAPDRIREANDAGLKLLHKPPDVNELKRAIAAACSR